MIFDKNQNEFPSSLHKAIWEAGTLILPLEITLPPEVRKNMPAYLVESCEQMQKFFLQLLGDVYENTEIYLPLPSQGLGIQFKIIIPFVDFALTGETNEDSLIINRAVFDKLAKKLKTNKGYESSRKSGSLEQRMKIFERNGMKYEYQGENVVLSNELYPNIFYAMQEMARAALKEKMSGDNSFTYCDFRILCKSYKYDKYENALVFLNDEQRDFAKQLDSITKELKFVRTIKSGHCPGHIIFYKYKGKEIINLNCMRTKAMLEINFIYEKNEPELLSKYFEAFENDSDELKKFVYKRLLRCRMCYAGCYENGGGRYMQIYGKKNKICKTAIGKHFMPDDIALLEKTLIHVKKIIDEML